MKAENIVRLLATFFLILTMLVIAWFFATPSTAKLNNHLDKEKVNVSK